MKSLLLTLLSLVIYSLDVTSTLSAEPTAGASQVTIVAFGDSTTARRGKLKIYADCLAEDLPKQGLQVNVINSGIGGHSTLDGLKRFEKDVTSHQPHIVIIQFGINDSTINVWKNPPDTKAPVSQEQYVAALEQFVETLRKQNCQVILMTPNPMRWTPALVKLYGKPPYLPEEPDGLNVTLSPFAAAVRKVAKQHQLPLIDVYQAFQDFGKTPGRSVDELLLDGMHPNEQGQRLVADLLIPVILKLRAPAKK